MIRLKGMTWDHARGYEPMRATAEAYGRRHAGVEITWERRSLQAFADVPVEELAEAYDLLVIDHPHVGPAAETGCLVALDGEGRDEEMAALAAGSIGGSHASYQFEGRQWALAIDAATQVASRRPDLLGHMPTEWGEVEALARAGRVAWALKPIDALMSFFTLMANVGKPCRTDGKGALFEREGGLGVLEAMARVARHVPRECLAMNPIEVYERMAEGEGPAYCPLGYGYTNYARAGYRGRLLRFGNIAGPAGVGGACLGGTGIAVSARRGRRAEAVDYAFWVASGEVQKGLYFEAGGQPAHAAAWEDARCNAATHGFFEGTRATLDASYLRPRYDGYLAFQDGGGTLVNGFLSGRMPAEACLDAMDELYCRSTAAR